MTTHFIISTDFVTNSVMVGSGAFPNKTANGSPYFIYITAIISGDPHIESAVFVWGTSPGEFVSPKMIEHAEKGHSRILSNVLFHCIFNDPYSIILDPEIFNNLPKPLRFKP